MRIIDEFKGKFKNKRAVIVGTGPTAENLDYTDEDVLIGVNRAIVLSKDFDFVFFDNEKTKKELARFKDNTKYFLSPMFSCGKSLIDNDNPNIIYFVWAWKIEEILKRSHVLDDNFLFIDWGNIQSAVHFAKKIGFSTVKFYGVDGQAINVKYHSNKIIETFGETRQPLQKLDQDYARTKGRLVWLATELNLVIE